MSQHEKAFFNEIEDSKLKGYSQIASLIELLLTFVIVIYLLFAKTDSSLFLWITTLVFIFYRLFFYNSKWAIKNHKIRLITITVAMICYVSITIFLTGKINSPLLSLYYLPIIVASLTLNRLITFVELIIITILCILMATELPISDIGLFIINLIPLWLVTWLTTSLSIESSNAKNKLLKLSQTDSLTGLWNMRMFNIMAEREHLRISRTNSVFTIIMLDADNLKDVNDTYGHQAGSKLIQHMGKLIKENLRATDLVARYGGDEFIIMLPETESSYAHMVAERIRSTIENTPLNLDDKTSINISVSLGIASSSKANNEIKDIIFLADRALYNSKKSGKNRTTIYDIKRNERI